jgi:hypothetical protein
VSTLRSAKDVGVRCLVRTADLVNAKNRKHYTLLVWDIDAYSLMKVDQVDNGYTSSYGRNTMDWLSCIQSNGADSVYISARGRSLSTGPSACSCMTVQSYRSLIFFPTASTMRAMSYDRSIIGRTRMKQIDMSTAATRCDMQVNELRNNKSMCTFICTTCFQRASGPLVVYQTR